MRCRMHTCRFAGRPLVDRPVQPHQEHRTQLLCMDQRTRARDHRPGYCLELVCMDLACIRGQQLDMLRAGSGKEGWQEKQTNTMDVAAAH